MKREIITLAVVGNKTEIGQIAEINLEEYHTETDTSLDKISGKEISEVETDEILGTTADLTGLEVDQETGHIQETLGERQK